MEGGGNPTYPGQSSSAAELPNKGVAVGEDEPKKDKIDDDGGSDDDRNNGSQGPQGKLAAAAMGAGVENYEVREEDKLMPMANINKIMRKVLPTHTKIAEDAKATVQRCVFEFMGYITAEANERCRLEQRKTVTAEDMLWAFRKIGFDEYAEHLSLFLHRYRLVEGVHRPARRDLLSEAARAATASTAGLHPAPGLGTGAQGYPAGSFAGEGGSSSAAAAAASGGGGVMMPQNYQRGAAGTEAGPSQGPQMFGFHPFARYN